MKKQYRVMVQYAIQSQVVYVDAENVLEAEREALKLCGPNALEARAMQVQEWVNVQRALAQAQRPFGSGTGEGAQQAHASHVDRLGHSGVQPWSAGALFPAVIARVERYADKPDRDTAARLRAAFGYCDVDAWMNCSTLDARLESVSYELILDGAAEEYATREDAESAAAFLIDPENIEARVRRRDEVLHA